MTELLKGDEVAELAKSRIAVVFCGEEHLAQVREWLKLMAAVNRIEYDRDS